MPKVEKRWFVTVAWCGKGPRGIFCDSEGRTTSSEVQHSHSEMQDVLGPFWMILDPISVEMTAEEVAEHNQWQPLDEYSDEFGIAIKEEDAVAHYLANKEAIRNAEA